MPTLIHLNGPACVGKSTIAAALAAERPLALCVDIDVMRTWLGGWQNDPSSKGVARAHGFALAARHLADGYDVVMPQLIVRGEVVDQLSSLASDVGASMVEVVLVADVDELAARLREGSGAHPRDEFTATELRAQMEFALRELPELAASRAFARVVDVSGMLTEAAVAAVLNALGAV